MKRKVLEFIKKHDMIDIGDRVVVALSGGADSVCLLIVLWELRKELNLSLSAVHVHHGLRAQEADRDAEFSRSICERLHIPATIVRRNVGQEARQKGISTEEAGRQARYECLGQEAVKQGADKIAVAHHGDDNAETILHHLFRGSGLKGLSGIPPVRGLVIRPLLCVTREEILAYLKEKGMDHCEDSTNSGNDYTRNKIRNQLLPFVVSKINEGATGNILHAGRMIGEANAYLENVASSILAEHERVEGEGHGIPLSVFLQKPPIIQSYMVKDMMSRVCGQSKDITARHIEDAGDLAGKSVGRQVDLPYGMIAFRDYECLWIKKRKIANDEIGKGENDIPVPDTCLFPYEKGQEIPKNQYTKWFDYDKIKGTLSVRYRRTGDFITLASGGKKTVKSYMIDEKIPREERDRIPLVADGDHILWIVGYRISEYYKVTDDTKMVIQVQFMEE